jgi:hypothetical protein
MKPAHLAIAIFFVAAGAFAIDPYDYWVAIAQVPDVTTPTSVIKKVVVFIGNNGPFGGPYYDVTLTVKTANGQSVCSAGLATQPALLKGQQRNVLVFQLSYPKGRPKLPIRKIAHDRYVIFANINTQYPNDDTNSANGSQSKEFSFPTGGQASCEKF